MSEHYEVYAVKYARMENRTRGNNFLFDDHADLPSPIEFFVWVIRNEARTILVDTGFKSREAAGRDREIEIEPAAALAAIGIAPESIDTCILTHLHFDRAGGLHQFENAHIHLQAAEMVYATGPCMCHATIRMPFTGWHVCEAVNRLYSGKLTYYDGAPARWRRGSPCTASAAVPAGCNACGSRPSTGRCCWPRTRPISTRTWRRGCCSRSSSMPRTT